MASRLPCEGVQLSSGAARSCVGLTWPVGTDVPTSATQRPALPVPSLVTAALPRPLSEYGQSATLKSSFTQSFTGSC